MERMSGLKRPGALILGRGAKHLRISYWSPRVESLAKNLTLLGLLFLLGLLADTLGRRTPLPRVTLVLCLGAALGPWLVDISPEMESVWFPGIAHIALVMVGFLLGGKLTLASLRERGRLVVSLSVAVVVCTAVVVGVGLALLDPPYGQPIHSHQRAPCHCLHRDASWNE